VDGFDPATSFGPSVARRYDNDPRGDESETVDLLEQLSRGGPALEFAIGTGRIALPLSERGVRVDGIELSPDMVARLREKPGGDAISVTVGDMSQVRAPATYRMVYLVFNTIYNLLTQDGQVRCFENAARHLTASTATTRSRRSSMRTTSSSRIPASDSARSPVGWSGRASST